jgi:hypothetical protein
MADARGRLASSRDPIGRGHRIERICHVRQLSRTEVRCGLLAHELAVRSDDEIAYAG